MVFCLGNICLLGKIQFFHRALLFKFILFISVFFRQNSRIDHIFGLLVLFSRKHGSSLPLSSAPIFNADMRPLIMQRFKQLFTKHSVVL